MEISGIVKEVEPVQRGKNAKGDWAKQNFIIDQDGQFPNTVCFTAWNKVQSFVSQLSVGDKIKVHFDVKSKKNDQSGRWFTEAICWRIEK